MLGLTQLPASIKVLILRQSEVPSRHEKVGLQTVKSAAKPICNESRNTNRTTSSHALNCIVNIVGSMIDVLEFTKMSKKTRFLCEGCDTSHLRDSSTHSTVDQARLESIIVANTAVLIRMNRDRKFMVGSSSLIRLR